MRAVLCSARALCAGAALVVLALACGGGSEPTTTDGGTGGTAVAGRPVTFSIAVDQDRAPISPYIYGTNQDAGAAFWTVRRDGGNRTTGYNWETNFSNAGSDYLHNSDLFSLSNAGIPPSEANMPGRAVTNTHDRSIAMSAGTIITLQMAGYVAADGNGPVSVAETAPSSRWIRVAPRKATPLSMTPDRTDGVVYMDEQVNLFVQRYGGAAGARGVRWYSLDNEPALWAYTHPRIHPQKVGAVELLERSVALATAVKAIDPAAEILGPAEYGMSGFYDLQSAPDWPQVKAGFGWYLDYYLDGMKKAGAASGKRLLDVLDVHWYPEARGDHRIIDGDATTAADVAARLQAPRSLWDPTYRESSWIQQALPAFLPLLPRLEQSIAQFYPGTKLAITEYDYGGKASISGGIAQADVLGIFGRQGVYLATIWGIGASDQYALAGFQLYRDYDGRRGTFGNTSVRATSSDDALASIHASIEGSDDSVLHLILLNKHASDTISARIQLSGGAAYTRGEVWGFDAASPRINARAGIAGITGNSFDYAVPPLTALHLVLRK
jgi:mannan endo-1,4-beta-mannosidase